ncbi:MAG: hypothetical protein K8R18_09975 [Parvibaculum sp.]|uniref:hypothetical protein n=1 Tax=Parvibaculum sp. TaxID=2024848 RepID=UPI0025FB76EF|nr:hypothetical protein [Parvibaculum sp.]MCE9649937.1 hypothetical protein [Parvibaculum sp.]
MVFGVTLATYTLIHVLISLAAIGSGFVVVFGFLTGRRLDGWTAIYLAATVATSATGFGFPFVKLLPPHIFGIISAVLLVPTLYARYGAHLSGAWNWIYTLGAVVLLYLNFFVLIVQVFVKVPAFIALAPTQTELPFVAAHGAGLILFIVLGFLSVRKFHGGALNAA